MEVVFAALLAALLCLGSAMHVFSSISILDAMATTQRVKGRRMRVKLSSHQLEVHFLLTYVLKLPATMSSTATAQDVPLTDAVAPVSFSFSMLDMVILYDAVSYIFMCRNKQFIVNISAERLRGEGGLVDTFHKFMEDDLNDPDVYVDFETWVIDAVYEDIQRLAPAPDPTSRVPTTLLEYYGAEKFALELVNSNGVLAAIEHPYDPRLHGDISPRVTIVDTETCDSSTAAPPPADPATHPHPEERDASPPRGHGSQATVCRSVLPAVPSLPASRLARATGLESLEERMCAVPQHVRDVETGREYFFKAANDERGFRREVQVLARIGALAKQGVAPLRTSRMAGLVHWDGREDVVMGMLLERIDGPTLFDAAQRASAADKSKWVDQIDETVGELHWHGLVWGDVKPDNVMIAPSGDAVVIDFGGGGTLQYIDLQLHETREGDVQGTGKMRARLLGGEGDL